MRYEGARNVPMDDQAIFERQTRAQVACDEFDLVPRRSAERRQDQMAAEIRSLRARLAESEAELERLTNEATTRAIFGE